MPGSYDPMNYFAHGQAFVDEPYLLAGTAVPDWLSVVNRRARVRSRHAAVLVDSADERTRQLGAGIARHLADDAHFHATPAFAELSLKFCAELRTVLSEAADFRPWFVGHVLVEILLDAHLIAEQPARLERYYAALDAIDGDHIEAAVGDVATASVDNLAAFVEAFSRERFLWDYLDDGRLLYRMNQVMRRVGLAPLPAETCELLPACRVAVASHAAQLLA